MERVVVAAVLMALAVAVALVLGRRRPDAPTQPRWTVPTQVDRADFVRPDVPWLVVLFSSASCSSCAGAWSKVEVLEGPGVAVQDVAVQTDKALHDRYRIDAVPTIVVVDADGVVCASFIGPPTATDLWAAVAEARRPGSSPEPDLGRPTPLADDAS